MFTDFTRLCFRKQESVRVSFPTYLAGPETAEGNLKNGRNEGNQNEKFIFARDLHSDDGDRRPVTWLADNQQMA